MPDRILTTHVGSLIRPPKLVEFWRAIEDGKPYDEPAFEACLTESVADIVRQQAETGIDIVSDGEFSKGVNWAFYVFKRLSGITVRPATPEEIKDPMSSMRGGRDVSSFPEFYAEYDAASGLGKRLGNRIVVNGPLQYSKQQVSRDIANLQSAVARAKAAHPSLQGFLPVVAPASALPGAKLEITRTRKLS
jgi:5-methyltetrahydropteroyltriglutamate--homocysteine methyltransferase